MFLKTEKCQEKRVGKVQRKKKILSTFSLARCPASFCAAERMPDPQLVDLEADSSGGLDSHSSESSMPEEEMEGSPANYFRELISSRFTFLTV